MRTLRTLEELRHVVGDVLDIASLSDAQMLQMLLKRANGSATMKLLLRAALSVARERQNDRIADLEQELEAVAFDRDGLETTLRQIRTMLVEHEIAEARP
jgi:polynucleotide 5'-kinase involved in rRNA processing